VTFAETFAANAEPTAQCELDSPIRIRGLGKPDYLLELDAFDG
jgi:hypothetical protein